MIVKRATNSHLVGVGWKDVTRGTILWSAASSPFQIVIAAPIGIDLHSCRPAFFARDGDDPAKNPLSNLVEGAWEAFVLPLNYARSLFFLSPPRWDRGPKRCGRQDQEMGRRASSGQV